MAVRRRWRWREGAGKRVRRLSSTALASEVAGGCSDDDVCGQRWRQRELAGRAITMHRGPQAIVPIKSRNATFRQKFVKKKTKKQLYSFIYLGHLKRGVIRPVPRVDSKEFLISNHLEVATIGLLLSDGCHHCRDYWAFAE